MSWTDKASIKHINKIKDIFNINQLVETGTYKGVNAELHSKNFSKVITCEIMDEYIKEANKRLKNLDNVSLFKLRSPIFLEQFIEKYKKENREDFVFFYLDAHFYDPSLKPEDRFVIIKELESLKGFDKAILCIHDFDNNLGHITYDGQPLNLELIKDKLLNINPNFKFYTNELSSCDIMKKSETEDMIMLDALNYVWSSPEKTYRGILYCVPIKINIKGLREI
ncbi:MAG: hypothetical protein ACTSUC_09915 [Promethearchaeota archaeon]